MYALLGEGLFVIRNKGDFVTCKHHLKDESNSTPGHSLGLPTNSSKTLIPPQASSPSRGSEKISVAMADEDYNDVDMGSLSTPLLLLHECLVSVLLFS